MSEAAPAPAPVAAEAPKVGVNADPTQFNTKDAMAEWAALPAEEAAADVKQAKLVFNKNGTISEAKSGKVTRIDENGHVIHLDKRAVNKAADQVTEITGYTGDTVLTPNQAIPALRSKRMEVIKAELSVIAERSTAATKNGERDLTSGPHARKLRAELADLSKYEREDATTDKATGSATETGDTAGTTTTGGEAEKSNGWDVLGDLVDGTTPLSPEEAAALLDAVSNNTNEAAPSAAEYAKELKGHIERAKSAKEAGNWTEYQKALLDTAVLTDAHNESRGSNLGEQFQTEVDKRLDNVEDGRKDHEEGGANKYKVPEALQKSLDTARDAFVKLTAERRGKSVGGAKALAEAKAAYDKARNDAGLNVVLRLKNSGATDQEIAAFGKTGAMSEVKVLAELIQAEQESKEASKSKLVRRFNDFWASNTGRTEAGKMNWKGMAKKAAVMGLITAIPGAGIGIAATSILGVFGAGAAGSALGAVMSSSIARSIFRSKVNHAGTMRTGASVYGEALVNDNRDLEGSEENLEAEAVTDRVMSQTEKLVGKNRRRHLGAIALGAAGSVGGYYAAKGVRAGVGMVADHFKGNGGHIKGIVGDKPGVPSSRPDKPRVPTASPDKPRVPTRIPNIPKIDETPTPGGVASPEGAIPAGLIDASKWKYPYNWVEETFKGENPVNKIHQLQEAARTAGYNVKLHNAGTANEWVSINGNSDTAYVVNILNSVKGSVGAELPATA